MNQKITILARSLAIIFIIFISLFALDTPLGIGFFIHLIPSLLLLIILILAWKKPMFGSLYLLISGFFTFSFHTYQTLSSFLLISAPPFLLGLLFLYSALMTKSNK